MSREAPRCDPGVATHDPDLTVACTNVVSLADGRRIP